MAHTTLARPGAPGGPCAGRCAHRDCATRRAWATRHCPTCGQPIGYGQPFRFADALTLVHVTCPPAPESEAANG